MILKECCMKMILEKFPDFNQAWQKHLEWWGDDDHGLCNDLSAFCNYVCALLQEKENEKHAKNIFLFIEQLMQEGEHDLQEAVATCFLESLINLASNGHVSTSTFVHLLGNESREHCKAWDEFTGVKTEGLW